MSTEHLLCAKHFTFITSCSSWQSYEILFSPVYRLENWDSGMVSDSLKLWFWDPNPGLSDSRVHPLSTRLIWMRLFVILTQLQGLLIKKRRSPWRSYRIMGERDHKFRVGSIIPERFLQIPKSWELLIHILRILVSEPLTQSSLRYKVTCFWKVLKGKTSDQESKEVCSGSPLNSLRDFQ